MHIRKFKTVVITKQKLVFCGLTLLFIIILATTISIIKPKNIHTFAASQDLYMNIIEKELSCEDETKSITWEQVVNAVLGFDIKDPKSILKSYSSMLDKEDIVQASPTPAPTQSTESETHDIESINASKGLVINNKTTYEVNAGALASEALNFKMQENEPQVLIVHTHTTESYTDSGKTKYSVSDSDRSTDETKNMITVGNAIEDVLNKNGIKTVHDKTVHDYPSYNGAYGRALTTIKDNLSQYPSIQVVLDVHRDGMVKSDGTKLKVTSEINGLSTAQVMLVVGSNATGLLHDGWRNNLKFACRIQKEANEKYPSLMRPIDLREERFNQHMTAGSLIVEVGSNGNTLEEAITGGRDIADVISSVIKNSNKF